jgi:drug/metabolite transporter (DMT)-like permease
VRRLLLLAFIWGWSFLFIKVVVEGVPPTFLAWGRVLLGLTVMLAFLRSTGERFPDRSAWGHLVVLGLAMSVMPFTLMAWGEEHITSALTSVLNACTPLFTAAFAAGLLHDRLRRPQIAGLVIALGGVAVLARIGGHDLAGSSLAGVLATVTATGGYGFGFAYARRFVNRLSPLQLSAGQLTAACLALLPFAGYDVATGGVHLSWVRLLCLVLLGAVGTGYAYLLNYRTLQAQGATAASLVTYLIPIVGVAAGVLVLSEPFSYRLLIGAVIVGFGIAMIQGRILGPREPAAPEATQPTAAPEVVAEEPTAAALPAHGVAAGRGGGSGDPVAEPPGTVPGRR